MKLLNGLLYTKEHEWVKVEGDNAILGITDYAQKSLGSIVYVELPEVDSEFKAGENFGAIESVKAASDVFIPVDGSITEINEAIVDEPGLLNEDAFANWMIKFDLHDKSQLDNLLSAEDYEKFCSEEA